MGEKIQIQTNHFPIEFLNESDQNLIYQFDIDVEILMRDGFWRSCKKDERFQVIKTIIERESFPFVWYDQGKTLYALEDLTLKLKKEYQCQIKHKKTDQTNRFRFLLINLVKTHQIRIINEFIHGQILSKPNDCVRILEILLKQKQNTEMINIKNQFYPIDQRLEDLGKIYFHLFKVSQ